MIEFGWKEAGWKLLAMLCIGIASGVLSVVMPIDSLSLKKFVFMTVGFALVFGGMEAFPTVALG